MTSQPRANPHYVFNCKAEALAAVTNFPELEHNTVFLTTKDHPEKGMPLVLYGSRHARRLALNSPKIRADIRRGLRDVRNGCSSKAYHSKGAQVRAVISKDNSPRYDCFPFEYREVAKLEEFSHELGHVLTVDSWKKCPQAESLADVIAAIYARQRIGGETGLDATNVWTRTFDFIHSGRRNYLTTPAIDALYQDSKVYDFSTLPYADTVAFARRYVDLRVPTDTEIVDLKRDYSEVRHCLFPLGRVSSHYISLVASTCLSTLHCFSFYMGARALQPFLEEGGVQWNGGHSVLSSSMRHVYKKALSARARYWEMDALADEIVRAPPPILAIPALARTFNRNKMSMHGETPVPLAPTALLYPW